MAGPPRSEGNCLRREERLCKVAGRPLEAESRLALDPRERTSVGKRWGKDREMLWGKKIQ